MATLEDIRARISSGLGRDTPPPPTLDSLKERIKRTQYAPIPEIQGMPERPEPQAFGSLKRGRVRLSQATALAAGEAGMLTPEQTARAIGEAQLDIAKAPPSPTVQRGLQEIQAATGFGEALSAIVRNPSAVTSVVGESLLLSLPALGLGAAGSLAGPGGTAAGVGAGSAVVEYSASLLESLQQSGVDPLDDEAVAAALQNPQFMTRARERAAKRGVAVGAFDALTAGLAGRLLRGASGVTSAVTRGAGELGIQAGGGAGGEAAAQLATEGRITAPGEVLLEAAAEVLPGVGEIALNLPGQRGRPTTPSGAGRQEPVPPGFAGADRAPEGPIGPELRRGDQGRTPRDSAREIIETQLRPGDAAREFVRRQIRTIGDITVPARPRVPRQNTGRSWSARQ